MIWVPSALTTSQTQTVTGTQAVSPGALPPCDGYGLVQPVLGLGAAMVLFPPDSSP
eukprot:m.276360 g.276360  ORF g.276360 m.276360 type:complete len:56 (+) comp16143_c1_seq1:4700-4867(+)